MRNPNLEITTQIGCRVNCIKYCPQEIILKNYHGEKVLTLTNFEKIIRDVPKRYPIIFSGLSEPFQNQDTPEMIVEAHRAGHPIIVFSTLVGLSEEGAHLIKKIPFERFTIHLPDPYCNANIPETEEYNTILNLILRNVEKRYFMDMGYHFVPDRSEQRVRREFTTNLINGRVFCDHHEYPDYFVLPNGNAYFCCQTRGQSELVGNLYKETYRDLLMKFPHMSQELQTNQKSICHRCTIAVPYWLYPIRKRLGDKLIRIGKRYFT